MEKAPNNPPKTKEKKKKGLGVENHPRVHRARVESELEDATGCSAPLGLPTLGERKRLRGILVCPPPPRPHGSLTGWRWLVPPPGAVGSPGNGDGVGSPGGS